MLATTGSADYIGRPERQVVEKIDQGREEIPGQQIEPIFEYFDTGTDQGQAELIFRQVANDPDFVAIIGPSTSGESITVSGLTAEAQIPVLSLAANKQIVLDERAPNQTKQWVFKFAQNDDLAADRLLGAIVQHSRRADIAPGSVRGGRRPRLSFLYSNDAFGRGGRDVFIDAVAQNDGQVDLVDTRQFPANLTEATPLIASMPEVDGIVIWGTAPGPALLVKALGSLSRRTQVFLSHGNATHQFLADAGPAAEGAIVVGSRALLPPRFLRPEDPRDAAVAAYQRFWRGHFSNHPSHFGAHAYDAVTMILDAWRDGKRTRPQIRDHIEERGEYIGVTGVFRFSPSDHAGLTADSFEVYSIAGNEFLRAFPSG